MSKSAAYPDLHASSESAPANSSATGGLIYQPIYPQLHAYSEPIAGNAEAEALAGKLYAKEPAEFLQTLHAFAQNNQPISDLLKQSNVTYELLFMQEVYPQAYQK